MAVDAVVMGLGYVGMPLVHAAVHAGLTVVGFDVSDTVVDGLMDSRSHIDDLADDDIAAIRERGFRATSDEVVLADADTIVICVPTPLDDDSRPNVGAVESAARAIARNLTPGTLVVLESTTYPGTTEELVRPLLEESGLRAGVDFHLAFSKIVGGLTLRSTEAARAFYGRFVETTVPAKGPREAETAKLLENTYRHVNIALVNEMAQFCHELGIDLWNAIDMASTKPFGFQAFYPGPGVGGHCIPIDPNYLSYNVKSRLGYPFRFVELAQEVNSSMPAYVVRRVQDLLNDDAKAVRGATVLLLGVTYKPNISDRRESPAIPLAEALLDHGADLTYHDPNIDEWTVAGTPVPRVDDALAAASAADVVVVVQNHREYDIDALARASQRFLDTKGKVTADGAQRL